MASASEILKAYLHCARTPAEDTVERIRAQLKKQYGAAEVELTVSVEPDLISGYVLQVGDRVFDNSGKSALAAITADAPSLAVMQTRVEDYKPAATTAEGGTVISAADGVVDILGLMVPTERLTFTKIYAIKTPHKSKKNTIKSNMK